VKRLKISKLTANKGFKLLAGVAILTASGAALASSSLTLGNMASQITDSFTSLTKLITATSYIAGIGFFIGAVMKFKQHKDAPTQTPIGQPITLTFVAASLLFLPTILSVTGATMFGSSGGSTSGPTGSVYSS
jgi:intracellular multiplication protein IcmD